MVLILIEGSLAKDMIQSTWYYLKLEYLFKNRGIPAGFKTLNNKS